MVLKERLSQDLTAAMKAKDAPRLSVLRMAKSALMKSALTALQAAGKPVDGRKVNEAARQRLGA